MKTSREIMKEVYTKHEIDKLSWENTDNIFVENEKYYFFECELLQTMWHYIMNFVSTLTH